MKITILTGTDDTLSLSNDGLDNLHYVDILINDIEVTIPADELYQAALAFKNISDDDWNKSLKSM